MIKGVVIGKFYPPHKGHKYLIDSASSAVDHLTVIICQRMDDEIPGKLRAQWIKKLHPKVFIKIIDSDNLDENDSGLWAEKTMDWLGYKPDIVFTSENYGHAYSKFMGSEHVLVDKDRKKFPISGTEIRKNPYRYWEYLEPVVRQFFVKRICIVGAESSGTTTMAKDLAGFYKTCWVPEYGRTYWEGKLETPNANKWGTNEFIHIASVQNSLEDELAKHANKVLICDTNSWATSIWHERYTGKWSKKVEKLSDGRKYDLYLITDIDIPFIQDGTRDGEHIREWMHQKFIKLLKEKGENIKILSGSEKKRLQEAVKYIDNLFSRNWI